MSRDQKQILSEVKVLINELEATIDQKSVSGGKNHSRTPASTNIPKGALGAITMLLDEGFFDSPKEIGALIEKLKQIGHYHKLPAVSMNLLNLTKRRVLNRFKNKDTKNWEYVIRK